MKARDCKGLTCQWSGLVVVSLLAFTVRMIRLVSRPLWYDESFAVLYASLSPECMVYGTVVPAQGAGASDVHPLLYYFLLHGWMKLAGQSPLAARFLSLILGMITVALVWRMARWCFGRPTGLTVGLLGATNPFHVAYSQEARMYTLLGLGAVTAAWGLLRALGDTGSEPRVSPRTGPNQTHGRLLFPVVGHWSLFVVGSTITLYAHNLGAFALLALHLLVIVHPRCRRHLPRLALADLVVLVLFSPWLVKVLPGQVGFIERGYWLSSPGSEQVVRAVMLPVLTFYDPVPIWLLGIGLFTSLLLLALLAVRAGRSRSQVRWFLLLCGVPILSLLLISRWRPLYLERALLPSALFYLVALGWLLVRGGLPDFLRYGLPVLLAVATIGSLGVHYTYAGFPRPPFQKAVDFLQNRLEAEDVVVHTSKLTYLPMHFYAPGLPAAFLADPPGSPQDTLARPTQQALGIFATSTISEAVGTARCAWLVYFPREVEEAQAVAGEHPALSWMEDRFVEVNQERFADLVVGRYRREGQ